ncbi:hypothetical protein EAH83_06160 [Variovorax ginsengisoli]|uniref:Uncharacterized protein n=1 Tax=Variovorax guangxiensis TaxID=1775474 RepID=A0A502DG95_9BURK|nr:hypothetical protein EAH82_20560 [Variovorax guangxiensis]TPG24082.1 hypothetical protein EAH83_06160 [Variovorax ginsengisoli]
MLVLGRRSHTTRFVRDENQARKLFRTVLPTFKYAEKLSSPISRIAVTKVGDTKSAPVTEWTVKLPRRQHARLLLPTDMTSTEVAALRKFLDAFEAQLPN